MGPREKADGRIEGRLRVEAIGLCEPLRGEGLVEPDHFERTRGPLRIGAPLIAEAQRLAQVDVEAAPPATERRKIVGRYGCERRARISSRPPEAAVGLVLEPQNAVAQEPGFHDRVGEGGGAGPEILRNHEAARPMALDLEDGEHRLERVGDIGARRGRHSGRDQELTLQLKGVVYPDRTRMTHVGGDKRAERVESFLLES